MKNWFRENYKTWAVYIIIAVLLKLISFYVGSSFLDDFLKENLVLLLPALLVHLGINKSLIRRPVLCLDTSI